jgi:uridine phosphorylase
MSNHSYLITPQQTLSAARQAGLGEEEMALSGIAVLTFSKAVIDRLEEHCDLQDATWLSKSPHPYATPHIVKRGAFQELGVTVLVPPMGASPMACIVEDTIACGAEAVFLVCPAWSLGPPVQFGDLIVPSFSLGSDGTSIHYGNAPGHITADPVVVEALSAACREQGATVHVGGNGSCEALYRITPQMVNDFRQRGCLCMENGEASTLFAMTQTLGVPGGAIFQPYIELEQGWDPAWLRDERYQAACHRQAEAVLEASVRLSREGVLENRGGRR